MYCGGALPRIEACGGSSLALKRGGGKLGTDHEPERRLRGTLLLKRQRSAHAEY